MSRRLLAALPIVCFFVPVTLTWGGTSSDVPLYYSYAKLLVAGRQLYSQVPVEYPPLAPLLFCIPYLFARSKAAYIMLFTLGMVACEALQKWLLWRHGSPKQRLPVCVIATVGIALMYYTAFKRFDIAATLLTTGFLLGSVTRPRALWPWLLAGLSMALKLYAIVLIPVVAMYQWRRGTTPWRVGLQGAVTAATFALIIGMGVWVGGDAGWNWMRYHRDRGVQIASTYAAGMILHHGIGQPLKANGAFGALQVQEREAGAWARRATGLTIATLLITYAVSFLGVRSTTTLWQACLAALCALLLCSKVFSPQYVIWMVPCLALATVEPTGRLDRWTLFLGLTVIFLSAQLFPNERYLMLGKGYKQCILLARTLGLMTMWAQLCWRLARRPRASRSSVDEARSRELPLAA